MKKIFIFVILFFLFSSCANETPDIVTSPFIIKPKLEDSKKCCEEWECTWANAGVPPDVACIDVEQLQSCLDGNKSQCPLKGYGAF